ncbi:putative Mitogen-activated protein kinase kinase kinase [Quillaja saponaria]|uniref:Mitogen-activated protein kinase kinase kinase n=1 Tax=Quillaja saponaria TaxID=32244 RepID=A0AAD7LMC2_QUISA|nr:putative Mitogen-activated protein kinase kinase kinase [Quillaja saponaria]
MYNLFLEYIPGGSLYDVMQRHGGWLEEKLIRSYTQQILKGITDDFAKSAFSGTPAFMAPEVARGEEQGFAADIWALGCTMIEMATGSNPWPKINDPVLALYRIGFSGQVPEIPSWLSEKGKDFLDKCLRRDSKERWTANELLKHPFLEELAYHSSEVNEFTMGSPSSVLDQGLWNSLEVLESPCNPINEGRFSNSPAERINSLVGGACLSLSNEPNWSWNEGSWLTVRSHGSEESDIFSEKNDVVLSAELSVANAEVIGSSIHGVELQFSLMFDEILVLQYSVENLRTSSTTGNSIDFVMAFEKVKYDFVLRNSVIEIGNENFFFNSPSFLTVIFSAFIFSKLLCITVCFFLFSLNSNRSLFYFYFFNFWIHSSSCYSGCAYYPAGICCMRLVKLLSLIFLCIFII